MQRLDRRASMVIPSAGHIDEGGLRRLNWDDDDIAWLKYLSEVYAINFPDVTEENIALADVITWNNVNNYSSNPDLVYMPKLQLPNSITSCYSKFSWLTYCIAVPSNGWDTTNITSFEGMFASSFALVSVGDLGKLNTANVTRFSQMFYNCYSLAGVGDISEWNTTNVTTLENMFYNCHSLNSVGDLSKWNTSNATTFIECFYRCYSLVSMGIPPMGANVTAAGAVGDMYRLADIINCGSITKSLSFQFSHALTRPSAMKLINALVDLTGQTRQILTLSTRTKALLSDADKAIATNKNWTIA